MLKIYMKNSRFLLIGNEFSGNYHKHIPLQIMISLEGNITACVKNGPVQVSKIFLFDSNAEHFCKVDSKSISLFIEPDTYEGKTLKDKFVSDKINILPYELIENRISGFMNEYENSACSCSTAAEIAEAIINTYAGKKHVPAVTDSRIKKILDMIPEIPDKKISVRELAAAAALSESRLIHLFKENMGIPIRTYLLWKRMIDAFYLINKGESLTMSALEAGFSDYAHFSRTFKKTFGVNVKKIFKNSRFIQVNICE